MWQRSCVRRGLRRAVAIFLTLKAERTTSVKRAEEEGGCEEVGLVFNVKMFFFIATQMMIFESLVEDKSYHILHRY